ncbi:MAG: DNA replication/repair protein RecF [Clostridia bacterium]|nr:DNA replication/repair protein RecF [Clostridia bacterium]
MWINNIKLSNFRNYNKKEINFYENINVFFGENAQGKTNIIESIFLGSIGKSFRTNKEKELIKFNEEKALIEINFQKSDRAGNIKIEIGDKKQIYLNGIKLKKLSELLGNINIVIFTPDDINILKGGPQNRRKFLDIMISQLRPNYMHVLTLYLKTLEQRNNYLKQIKLENKDENLLDIWDEKLIEYGMKIYEYRNEFIEKLKNKIKNIHKEITQEKEDIEIKYFSDANTRQNFINELKSRRKLDIIKGFTTKGIHRDDFVVYINGREVEIYGSQGQHRTAILSLKLSELKVIYDEIGEYPILLLDDFMSELDDKRRKNFLNNIKDIQVIITCTEKITLENLKYFSYNVIDGNVIEQKEE